MRLLVEVHGFGDYAGLLSDGNSNFPLWFLGNSSHNLPILLDELVLSKVFYAEGPFLGDIVVSDVLASLIINEAFFAYIHFRKNLFEIGWNLFGRREIQIDSEHLDGGGVV